MQDWTEREAELLCRSKNFIQPGMELWESSIPRGQDFIPHLTQSPEAKLRQEERGFRQSRSLDKAHS